ncbi:MAG TPA: hypothetical protein VGN09_28580 [Vicinamibacteria bacterium]|jgi:hypothetical protein
MAKAKSPNNLKFATPLRTAAPAIPVIYDFDATDCDGYVYVPGRYVPGHTAHGPVWLTWGGNQDMASAWPDEYCDEAYAISDAKDSYKKTVIEKARLNAFAAAFAFGARVWLGH